MMAKLTTEERDALGASFNLADGHARNLLPEFWDAYVTVNASRLENCSQADEEQAFVDAFCGVLAQSLSSGHVGTLLLPSASLALEVVAHILTARRSSLVGPEPCFDNVIDIFRHHGINVTPYRVDADALSAAVEAISRTDAGAVLVVAPGNPTGCFSSMSEMETLVDACARHRKLLVIDASFRAFSRELSTTDLYELLTSSAVSFFAIEDTGKFVGSYDLKTSILVCGADVFSDALDIYDDLMIGQSQLTLAILSATLTRLGRDGVERLRALVEGNRTTLRASLPPWIHPVGQSTTCSVEWVRTLSPASAADVQRALAAKGLAVLPGRPFYWSSPRAGTSFLRVALLRDASYFEAAMRQVGWLPALQEAP